MLIGYARTSTMEQIAGLEAQRESLRANGCERLYEERTSSVAVREALRAALDYAREGDTLVVTKLDRLARSVRHLGEIVEELEGKGVALRILDLGLDTSTATGKLMLNVLGSVAQFEREMMLERQKESIAKAKDDGRYKGRKPTAMAKAEDTYGEVAKEFQSIVLETQYFDTDYRTAIRNQALQTPSDELSQFLTDMLSIINSGGDMTDFLDDKKDKHMRTAKQEQEMSLDTLELFGEMYMTLSLFPLLLIIILVIMSMLGEADQTILWATVYGLIPLTGAGFLVLVSTVKQDEPGDG